MYARQQEKQLIPTTINWLQNSFATTHIGTLNLQADSRTDAAAENVAGRFNHKLHSILYGATKWKKGKSHLQLPILFVLHNHKACDSRPHLHIAFGGLKDFQTNKKFEDVFNQAAKKTQGVQFYWQKCDYWYAHKNQENDITNDARYSTKYKNINGREQWNLHRKNRLSVHFNECIDSNSYLHYICRRLQQGSSSATVLFQHMHNS